MQFIVSSENGFLRKKTAMSPIPISLFPIPDEEG